jgi:hypothetical protein
MHDEAGGGEDGGGLLGEQPRLAPAVVADHGAAGPGVGDLGRQVGGQARGHLADLELVHALGTGRQDAADAGGPELQAPRESLGELGGRGGVAGLDLGQERAQLGAGVGIGVAGQPGAGEVDGVHAGNIYVARSAGPARAKEPAR